MTFSRTGDIQREIQGLLSALREHGRQTLVLDPPEHLVMREKLKSHVHVDFVDTPLVAAVSQLAEQVNVDLRLDIRALRDIRIREREPITLKPSDHSLETVLRAITMNFGLTWVLRDGVLWITSQDNAQWLQKTAVYDVRDLCRGPPSQENGATRIPRKSPPSTTGYMPTWPIHFNTCCRSS